jgi:hypothetical protein
MTSTVRDALVRAALLRALPPLPAARRMCVPALPGPLAAPRVPRLHTRRPSFSPPPARPHPCPEIFS